MRIRIAPDDIEAVSHGEEALPPKLLHDAGLKLNYPCGMKGTCGKCRIRFTDGRVPTPTPAECDSLTEAELDAGIRLACCTTFSGDAEIEIPETSRLGADRILTGGFRREIRLSPNVHKFYLEPEPASGSHHVSDLDSVLRIIPGEFRPTQVAHSALARLPLVLRQSGYRITVAIVDGILVDVEPGDTHHVCHGIAFDIGTTTVVGTLMNLVSGQELATVAAVNPQQAYSADTISRITYVNQREDGLATLHHEIVKCVNHIIHECCRHASVGREQVYEVTVAANAAMAHIFLNVTPVYLGLAPYMCAYETGQNVHAATLGVRINPEGRIFVFPNIGSYVGGDTVAVILVTRMHLDTRKRMMVDIGTNGETALTDGHGLIAVSTPAGPALEGAQISQGMRASRGAIERMDVAIPGKHGRTSEPGCLPDPAAADFGEYDLIAHTIENGAPAGICGSGLIDAAARLLELGIIQYDGKLADLEQLQQMGLAARIPPKIHKRVLGKWPEVRVLLTDEHPRHGKAVYLTQNDVRELQLAKGTIRAAMEMLLAQRNLAPADIDELYLAGAFGNYIRKESAATIGLIPRVPLDRITFIGNAASEGAKLALLSMEERSTAEREAHRVEFFEMAGRPEFQDTYMMALMFE